MRAAVLIAGKDLRGYLRSRSLLVLGFLAPLGLVFVLNLVFGGVDEGDSPVTFDVGVAVSDDGDAARGFRELLDELAGSGLFELTELDGPEAARAAVEDGDVGAAWVVPAGFSAAVESGAAAEVTVVGDVDSPATAAAAAAVAERYAIGVRTAVLAASVAVGTGAVAPDEAGAVADAVAEAPPLAQLGPADSDSEILDMTTSLAGGLALFFVFFTAGVPVVSLLEERRNATLARLLAAPIPSASVNLGKAAAGILLGVTSLASLMVATSLLLGADWGPPAGAFLLAVAAVVSAAGIMSVAGGFARTPEQAGNLQALVAVVLAFLGGAFVPIPASSSGLLARLQGLTPHGWFLDGVAALRDDGWAAALPAIGALVAIGAATGAVGLARSRRLLR